MLRDQLESDDEETKQKERRKRRIGLTRRMKRKMKRIELKSKELYVVNSWPLTKSNATKGQR